MMKMAKVYKAFGLIIKSELPIPQLQEIVEVNPDVRIVRAQLRGIVDPDAPTTARAAALSLP